MKIVIDSSVIIDFTRAGVGVFPNLFSPKNEIYVPTIVISELWAGKSMNKKENRRILEKIIKAFRRVDLDEKIARKTGELLRSGVILGFDAIIAATALSINAQLATSNLKHFQKVKNLKFFKI
jgi:predicted nucleic acid-binding protein